MREIYICPDCGYWGIEVEETETGMGQLSEYGQPLLEILIIMECKECGWSNTYRETSKIA